MTLILKSYPKLYAFPSIISADFFKAVCGDSLGNYIQRLRLEYIAFKLISTNVSVSEILSQINYQNKHTLSRAFKNYFNCSIPEFRKRHSNACSEGKNPIQIEPSIERVPHTRIAYLKLERTHHVSHSFSVLWKTGATIF